MLQEIAKELNRRCHCVGTDVAAVQIQLAEKLDYTLETSHPHLFSDLPVFVSSRDRLAMQEIIQAVESVIAMPNFQQLVMNSAPHTAALPAAISTGVLGYDFHLTPSGPQLIEINTNPGGALLCMEMLKAQALCCDAVSSYIATNVDLNVVERQIVETFQREWVSARGGIPLKTIAIVDENPKQQYLYPEFLLFQALFRRFGIEAIIVGPDELRVEAGRLWHAKQSIDLVYNRLTDFYFDAPANAELKKAYREDAVVVTPNPRAHALYANKNNLVVLTHRETLQSIGVDERTIDVLVRGIPRTVSVTAADEVHWWSKRKSWFFKPVNGFGSKGTYRGDKITRGAFAGLFREQYVAQQFSPPPERMQRDQSSLKFDVRYYTHRGQTLLTAARLYQGQTTNFRTPGGGFAPIYTTTPNKWGSC